MNKNQVNKLIVKLINNSITESESNELVKWLEDINNLKYFNEFIEINHLINSKKKFDHRFSLKEFMVKTQKKEPRLRVKLFYAAASIAILISISLVVYIKNVPKNNKIDPVIVNNDIKIGTDKAVLTLGDGSTVVLDKDKHFTSNNLESNGEDLIYKSPPKKATKITYNYLTIPRGGQYHVTLSDGTQVWLNSESQLKYPVHFSKNETRIVELIYGEAYFKVSPSTNHNNAKFKVISNTQDIEVLGTEFNIKAYLDEDKTYTTLVEGSIALHSFNTKTILKPNEQAVLDKKSNSLIISSRVDTYSEIAWKRGLFSFKDKTLKDIMKVLSRWYDINIIFEDKTLETVKFKGVISKKQNLTDILLLIKNTNYINSYEIKQNTLILK
ncbi:FecR family protein [Algibacter pacificus]|uniref:FecR family protein n=1 Tax=Algibacter pacificus TaxID=2599389 RepID=UPI0011CC5AB7|nr:FecR family protein [Algibacter pacificus]